GVLTNDTDADNNSLTAVLNTSVSHGTLTFNANGSFLYTPTAGYSGSDSFTYPANDGSLNANVVTVSLTVSASTLVSIAVTPAAPTIAAGTTKQFTATGTYSDASTAVITGSVSWAPAPPATPNINAG